MRALQRRKRRVAGLEGFIFLGRGSMRIRGNVAQGGGVLGIGGSDTIESSSSIVPDTGEMFEGAEVGLDCVSEYVLL